MYCYSIVGYPWSHDMPLGPKRSIRCRHFLGLEIGNPISCHHGKVFLLISKHFNFVWLRTSEEARAHNSDLLVCGVIEGLLV